MTCEKCWTDAGGDAMAYAVLVRERTESGVPCTPREQCGERHTKGGDDLCACRRAKREAERAVIDAAKARLAAVERYNDLRREGRTHADALVRQADRACETLLDELGTATMALRTLEGP